MSLGFNQKSLEEHLKRLAVAFERLADAEEKRNKLMQEHLDNEARATPYVPPYGADDLSWRNNQDRSG